MILSPSLNEAKKHLNIEDEYLDDDNYILMLIDVAVNAVENHINRKLEDVAIESADGNVPSALIHAILLFIGHLYANREIVAFTNITKLPYSFEYLLSTYINY